MTAAPTKPKGTDEEEGGREMGGALNLQGTVIMNVSLPRVSVQSEKGVCPERMLALLIIHLVVRGPHLRKSFLRLL